MKIAVMAEAAEPSRGHPRLTGIDFPGMEVEHYRLAFLAVDSRNPPLSPRVGKNPEIPTSCHRNIEWAARDRRGWDLYERAAGSLQHVRVPRGKRNAVPIVPD